MVESLSFAQMSLNLDGQEALSFDNFYLGRNQHIISLLSAFCASHNEQTIYLWGPPLSGRTHLLQAVCLQFEKSGQHCMYVPLGELINQPVGILEGLESYPLLCIDDIQAIAGNREWEEALFHLYNRVLDSQGKMLFSANDAPEGLGVSLPDLQSRLSHSVILKLQSLSETEKGLALQMRAHERKYELSDEVVQYLLKRIGRDMKVLMATLSKFEQATLSQRRVLTVPFVKQLLRL